MKNKTVTNEVAVTVLQAIIDLTEEDGSDMVTRADIPILRTAIMALNEKIESEEVT